LFPTWIQNNFNDYVLPEIMRKEGEDPCKESLKNELRTYQKFIGKYLDYKSPYRSLLLYHGLGSGKTITAIHVYNMLYNYTPNWNVFILIKATLKNHPWLIGLKHWLAKDDNKSRFDNLIFVHYDSPFADRDFHNAIKKVDSSKKTIYMIDEIHNFIRNVYSNISTHQGRRAQVIYDYIIQDLKDNEDTRLLCLTATPTINVPYELGILFNMLRPGIFPRSEVEFNKIFVSSTLHSTMNRATKNMFQRRIMGLVSYYYGATPDKYAKTNINFIDIHMSKYQEEIYDYFEGVEDKLRKQARQHGKKDELYRSYTRQACNFVFPSLSQNVSGEQRPRPGKFRISEVAARKVDESRIKLKLDKKSDKFMNITQYLEALTLYVKSFDKYLHRLTLNDEKRKHTIDDDVKLFKTKYGGNYKKFKIEEKNKSDVYKGLYKSSPKMLHMIFNILISKGPVLVYSNYVLMEGLQMFKTYLKQFGFRSYFKDDRKTDFNYVEYHGGIKDPKERSKAISVAACKDNIHGKIVKIVLISPAGSEGISLRNIRQVHIMEPYWHEVRIKQMVGRAVRLCSHADLPIDERVVDVYRYKSIHRKKGGKPTTDQHMEGLAMDKEKLLNSFLEPVKEVAIDCELNKAHNMILKKYDCFKFDEKSLFAPQIGPAYKEDIYDDLKIDDGLNSVKSRLIRIKVKEIKGVTIISPSTETTPARYSDPIKYWYYSKSDVIYDYNLKYAIGKIQRDINNVPVKLNPDTYVIEHIIVIPKIKSMA
jgi:hypothetical protein